MDSAAAEPRPPVGGVLRHALRVGFCDGGAGEFVPARDDPARGRSYLPGEDDRQHLRAGVEVERGEEDGFFRAESVAEAIKTVMEKEERCNEVGREVRGNRAKLQKLFSSKDLEASYIDEFSLKLQSLVCSDDK